MSPNVLIAGGGIGGLAAALACAQAGAQVRVLERSPAFNEYGAGIQLGPNAMRVLLAWGLHDELARVASFPRQIEVRSALTGRRLGVLPLGVKAVERYGAPYATMHRADLHWMLLSALARHGPDCVALDAEISSVAQDGHGVTVSTRNGPDQVADLLVGADGLWSVVREQTLADEPPTITGHLAYRALASQALLPQSLRSDQVTVWLGPDCHVVTYPVRGQAWLNIVAIVRGQITGDIAHWDHTGNAARLRSRFSGVSAELVSLIEAISSWRLWVLCHRKPLTHPKQMGIGRIALLGDAAHPMLPYMAQGAGMAIEDAVVLAQMLSSNGLDATRVVQRYALARWQRNARVQARAQRNGEIFHADGLMRFGRDLALRLMGERLLDVPWLYQHRVAELV